MTEGSRTDPFAEINSADFLARLLVKGSDGQRAFARLVQATHDRFLAFIHRHLSGTEECREVLQEMYLAVHKGLPSFAGRSKLTTWMYSLAHHKICDRLSDKDRKHKELTPEGEASLSTESGAPDGWDRISDWDSPADKVATRNRAEGLIVAAVAALPEAARQVYHLRDVEGLSGEEAAVILKTTEANVRVQLHRARRQIVEWVQVRLEGKA
jgi:RNA polymerase sigma-70 factor (ECF subfamily)